jgi:hypothetical protein
MTDEQRAALDDLLRAPIRAALSAGFEASEIASLLMGILPELCDRTQAHGHVIAAFDLANRDSDRALPFQTGPFELADPE